jgi:hypothetical protein
MAGTLLREPWVTDDVWASLNSSAGSLSRKTCRRTWAVGLVMLALTVAGAVLWQQGYLSSRVGSEGGTQGSALRGSHVVSYDFEIFNHGPHAATVSSLVAGSGLRVESVRGLRHSLAAHTGSIVSVRLQVTDCATARHGTNPISARVAHWWGHTDASLHQDLGDLIATACRSRR